MSRARATALTLVNWKGVFFERYLLDRHVTALEGANGAGKTTVMIAAYVVLLPDLTRLKFVNLGETGATGGDRGIWGRLGELGPSYAALEIELGDGERVLAGVYLERKAAPALSLTPFVLSGWPSPQSPQRFFLRDTGSHEQVQTLADLAQSAEEAKATLEVFSSSKDYFAHLFDRGINPLRLSTDEERNKLNDMLRTSMTGGISRTLTSDLRSFLFKQQTGLFDTLSRMRKNLEACRRTRLEVSEARVLEHEINGIYAAGHAMFSAALAASRGQATESRRSLEQREQERTAELARAEELETALSEMTLRKNSLGQRASRARDAEAVARERLLGMTRALGAAERLGAIEAEYARVQPEAELALTSRAEANAAREQAKRILDEQQQTLLRAAAGLASLQAGLEELHRQAHAFRRVHAQLDKAQTQLEQFLAAPGADAAGTGETILALRRFAAALQAAALGAGAVGAPSGRHAELSVLLATGLQQVNQARHELDRARAERDRRAEVAARRRQDHAEARAALASITGGPVDGDLAARAREELGRLSELSLLGGRVAELGAEWQEQAERAERQRALMAEVRALGFDPLPSARELVMGASELEVKLRACELKQREHEQAARHSAEREQALRTAEQAALGREEGYRRLAPSAARLGARGEGLPKTRAELNSRLRAHDDARRDLQSERSRVAAERQAATSLALEHELSGGGPHADLVRLAELIDGHMLAGRYEELDVEPARRAEAELGPLVNAIVVEEPARALPQVLSHMHEHESVWLLEARAEWPLATVEATAAEAPSAELSNAREAPAASVVVDLGYGFRVTRLPRTVSLGRAARRRQIERLRSEAEAAGRGLAALDTKLRENDAARRDLEALQEHWEVWAAGDPKAELERVRGELATLEMERAAERHLTRQLRVDAARLAAELAALKAQLGDHHLLDPPDYGPRAERARETLDRAKGAAAELARVAGARRTLEALVHGLGDAPPGPEEVAAWRLEQPLLEAQRDRLFAVAEALAAVDEHRAAWAWADAERALGERTELVPELEAQHSRALTELGRGHAAVEAAEASWEAATARAHAVTAQLSAVEAHLARAREELRVEGVSDPSSEALQHAQKEAERLGVAQLELRAEESAIDADLALGRERLLEAEKRSQRVELEVQSERDRAQPAERQWQLLHDAARAAGVLEADEGTRSPVEADAPSSQQRWLEAQAKLQLLGDRLAAARGGAELGRGIAEAAPQAEHGAAHPERGSRYLELWLAVRAWLLRRLPTPVAELGEPLLGLARLGADLTELGGRLERQEGDLRGTSGDVARSIDVQVRQATAQLRRLNQSLVGVSFGSIYGIRVQLERVEKMDQVLSALRDGETQELLFQSNLPIEEALDEIFRRHAGGRTGGQRLVDYREYLDLHVQIQRRPDQGWERVNPSQVSTGEAIGIGAALMMVILAEWERDDQLLRRERNVGSLRFLFLDEANRLSPDNLGVLFDLCQALDLQLLIAAPEVARAEGNTTYRLVRRVSDDGREEVLVTGRRATLPAELGPELRELDHPAPKSEQLALLGT